MPSGKFCTSVCTVLVGLLTFLFSSKLTSQTESRQELTEGDFSGWWIINEPEGDTFYIIVKQLGRASSFYGGPASNVIDKGTWVLQDNRLTLTWENGFRDVLLRKEGRTLRHSYFPGSSLESEPDKTVRAHRLSKERVGSLTVSDGDQRAATLQPRSSDAHPSRSEFVGFWEIERSGEAAVFYFLERGGRASRAEPGRRGTELTKGEWKQTGNEVRIHWEGEPQETIRKNSGQFDFEGTAGSNRIYTAPIARVDATEGRLHFNLSLGPAATSDAFVGFWRVPDDDEPYFVRVDLWSHVTRIRYDGERALRKLKGRWTMLNDGVHITWQNGSQATLRETPDEGVRFSSFPEGVSISGFAESEIAIERIPEKEYDDYIADILGEVQARREAELVQLRAEQAAKREAEEQARLLAEEEEQKRIEEEERALALAEEEKHRLREEVKARRLAKEEAIRLAREEERQRKQEIARQKAKERARQRALARARTEAEKEARRRAADDALRQAEAIVQDKAIEEKRIQAEKRREEERAEEQRRKRAMAEERKRLEAERREEVAEERRLAREGTTLQRLQAEDRRLRKEAGDYALQAEREAHKRASMEESLKTEELKHRARIASVESRTFAPPTRASLLASLPQNDDQALKQTGSWQVYDSEGDPYTIQLGPDGTASSSWAKGPSGFRGQRGNWREVNGTIHIGWNDDTHDAITPDTEGYAFSPSGGDSRGRENGGEVSRATPVKPAAVEVWDLAFEDEFDGPQLEESRWNRSFPWNQVINNELAGYSPDNVRLRNGKLVLTANDYEIEYGGRSLNYTSGVVTSFNKFEQTFGYFEIRCRVPEGRGLWPAFWLISKDRTPEIDVMDILGHEPDRVYFTTLSKGEGGERSKQNESSKGVDFSRSFHTVGVKWTEEAITYYINGKETARFTENIPSKPMSLVISLAVGGDWPGPPSGWTPFPVNFEIESIRVYERNFDWLARQEEEKVRKAAEREAHLEADIARLRVEAKERHESEAERLLSDETRRYQVAITRLRDSIDSHREAEKEALSKSTNARRDADSVRSKIRKEQSRLEELARQKAEEEARRRAGEEARRKAEADARRLAAEEARRRAEEERRREEKLARHRAEEEARRNAEEKAARIAAIEEKRKAREVAERKTAEEARLRAERERAKAEEKRRRAEIARLAREEREKEKAQADQRRAEDAARIKAEIESQRIAEREKERRIEASKRQADQELRLQESRRREAESARKRAEERLRETEQALTEAATEARQKERNELELREELERLRAENERLKAETETRQALPPISPSIPDSDTPLPGIDPSDPSTTEPVPIAGRPIPTPPGDIPPPLPVPPPRDRVAPDEISEELIFTDMFNSDEVETASWSRGIPEASALPSSRNGYAEENAKVTGGHLRLKVDDYSNQFRGEEFSFTGAAVSTRGKIEARWGRLDTRIKVPLGKGLASSIHLMGSESDRPHLSVTIPGREPDRVYLSVFNSSGQISSSKQKVKDFSLGFGELSLVVQPGMITLLLNGQEIQSIRESLPAESFYLLFAVGVGGEIAGEPSGWTPFPSYFEVDSVSLSRSDTGGGRHPSSRE